MKDMMEEIDNKLTDIAQATTAFEHLNTQYDREKDFQVVAVWQMKQALMAAYRAGYQASHDQWRKQLVTAMHEGEGE